MLRFPTILEQGILALFSDSIKILKITEDTLFNVLDILGEK